MSKGFGFIDGMVQALAGVVVIGGLCVFAGLFTLAGAGVFAAAVVGAFLAGGLVGDVCARSTFAYQIKEIEARERALRLSTRFEVHVKSDTGQWGAFLDSVPGDKVHKALLRVSRGGRAFTVRDMDGVLSRTEFESLRAELIERGFVRWRDTGNHQLGIDWTRAGLALLRVVEPTPPPDRVCASVCNDTVHTHAHTPQVSTAQPSFIFAREGDQGGELCN